MSETVGVDGCHREDGRSRGTVLQSTRRPGKCTHTLAEYIRMSSLEGLLPDDLEKHVQMNRARLNSCNLLREEIKTYREYRGHASVRTKQKGPSHPGGDDPINIGAFGKGKHGKGKCKGKQGQQGQHGRDKDGTRARLRWNVGTMESADISRKTVGARMTTKVKEITRRSRRTLTILTRRNQRKETKLKLVDFTCVPSMQLTKCESLIGSRLELTQVQERRLGPRMSHGLGFRTATGDLVNSNKQLYVDGSSFRIRDVQAPVCNPLLSVGEYTTMGGVTVLYGNKGYNFHKGSTVAKKIDAWIQKELRDSQCHGCTIAYTENNVYNIHMKPRRNETDAVPLPEDSESGGSRPGPNL